MCPGRVLELKNKGSLVQDQGLFSREIVRDLFIFLPKISL